MKIAESINEEEGRCLLRVARHTLERELGTTEEISFEHDPVLKSRGLFQERGVFVTLKKEGQLRGCIGNIEPCGSVVDAVKENALNSAFHDSRFTELLPHELEEIRIEVSVLTEPVPLDFKDRDELLSKLHPGTDGVILKAGGSGATFLPQVWEQLPDPEVFLSHLCRKAGLRDDAWRNNGVKILTYRVNCFEE